MWKTDESAKGISEKGLTVIRAIPMPSPWLGGLPEKLSSATKDPFLLMSLVILPSLSRILSDDRL